MINVIFEGGGIKGLAYIGVLSFLEERGFKILRIGGSSVGAVFAALIAVGYNSKELKNIANQITINNLKESNSLGLIFKEKGINSIDALENLIDSLCINKQKRYFKSLKYGDDYLFKLVTTDMTNKKMVILPNDLYYYNINPDNFKISKAVAMSSSIPLFYEPYKLNNNIFYDGGISSNLPFFLFDNKKDNINTICFRFSKSENKIGEFMKKIFIKNHKLSKSTHDEVYINADFVKSTDFKKGLEIKEKLYLTGYNATKEYFYKNIFKDKGY